MPSDRIKSNYFKQILLQHWPEVKCVSRPGYSDLVCSKLLTVDDALKKKINFSNIATCIDNDDCVDELSYTDGNANDEVGILHKAAEILIKRVSESTKLEKEYFSPSEVSIEGQKSYIDPLLLRFISWLSDKTLFNEAKDITDIEPDQKVISVCSDLTALIAKVTTPKHLGLTVYLHHTYGSKKLIEDLCTYGHTLPYAEVRHFLTSAAVQLAAKQQRTDSGALVPANVQHRSGNGQLLVGAADNWDHNERTLSGKKTTHAKTSLLVTPQALLPTSERLPRVSERSLNICSLPGKGVCI